MFLSLQCLAPHESVAYAYISSIKEAVEWGDGVFVWEREWGGVGAALWSTQPHYSVDRTAHLLHCSSNQPKLTGILWSPQNRTELQMRSPERSVKSAVITFFKKYSSLSKIVKWFLLRTSFVISISEWYEDDTNTKGEMSCWDVLSCAIFPRGESARWRHVIARDTFGSNDQRACMAWWIIPRNVNWLGLCCSVRAWRALGRGVCRANNGNTKWACWCWFSLWCFM